MLCTNHAVTPGVALPVDAAVVDELVGVAVHYGCGCQRAHVVVARSQRHWLHPLLAGVFCEKLTKKSIFNTNMTNAVTKR